MSHISIRLDQLNDSDINLLLNFVSNQVPERYIMSKEIAKESKKAHFHVYLETNKPFKKVWDAFAYKFKRSHPGGKRSCARVLKLNSFLAYIVKDGNILYKHGFTSSDISSIKKWVSKDEFKSKTKMVDILHQVVGTKVISRRDIMYAIINHYSDTSRGISKFTVMPYVDTIFYRNTQTLHRIDECEEYFDSWL